jgi:hypothetical protein
MYQPQFTRELNILGTEFNWKEALEFLSKEVKAIQFRNDKLRLIENGEERKHQWLSLNEDLKFSTNAKRLIKKANQNFIYKNENDPKRLIELFKSTAFQKIDTINEEDILRLKNLMTTSLENGHGETISVYANGNFVGGGFFLKDKKRITYLKSACTEEAKKNGAMYGLVNFGLSKFKEDYDTFDFGGSDVESVANFYKKFGSSDRTYYNYTIDNLPSWFKTLKRLKK